MRIQALKLANYFCEMDSEHKSFIAEATNKPYMEGHHIIPMKLQPQFEYSLDIYANIICLCPMCHKKIHYGLKAERQDMLEKIYSARRERLFHCGMKLSKDKFIDIIING